MYAGKIVEFSSTDQLFENPLHPYTRALLAAVPKLKKEKLKNIPGTLPNMKEVVPGCNFAPRCDLKGILCFEREPRFKEVETEHWVSCYEIKV
jgi:oligopeptide/dipeptide ABC transporter ATP-binding protein